MVDAAGRPGPVAWAADAVVVVDLLDLGIVIEYTAEVEQIDDGYRVGAPEDWTWPPGRVDQWGISLPPSARLKQAQREVLFAASL